MSGQRSKLTIDDCQKIAELKGGNCLAKVYINNSTKMPWECEEKHIWLATYSHIKASTWCPTCDKINRANKSRHTLEYVFDILRSKRITPLFNEYKNGKTHIKCQCKKCSHIWLAIFNNILRGHGCPKCNKEKATKKTKNNIDEVSEIFDKIGAIMRQDFYNNRREGILVECKKCSWLWRPSLNNAMQGKRCPRCFRFGSKPQVELQNFINSLGLDTINNTRKIIPPLELDVYIPEKNIAIEYCGLYWHRDVKNKSRDRHVNKRKICKEKGIELITIFESEWVNKNEQVKSYLIRVLGKSEYKIDVNDCEIRDVLPDEAIIFHNLYNIQKENGNKHKGLYFNNELIYLMSYSLIKHKMVISLISIKCNYLINDGLNKLLQSIGKIKKIMIGSDNRFGEEDLYLSTGFIKTNDIAPTYFYFKKNTTKIIDKKDMLNISKRGYFKIWDCGKTKWTKII